MQTIYVLVPLMQTSSPSLMLQQAAQLLRTSPEHLSIQPLGSGREHCVKVRDFNLTYGEIEAAFQASEDLAKKMDLLEEALREYEWRGDGGGAGFHDSLNIETLMRKAKKTKQLKQQNKKLKKLLQIQLENTEKVREQTQRTMRTLKQEFDALVAELHQREEREQAGKQKKQPNREKDRRQPRKDDLI